jgi:hypothetical protein
MAEEHVLGSYAYELRPEGLVRRRIGFKPKWEPCAPLGTSWDGSQGVMPGIAPVTQAERVQHQAQQPLAPRVRQDHTLDGLFDRLAHGQKSFF